MDWFHKALGLRRDDTFSTTMLNYVIQQLSEDQLPYPGEFAGCVSFGFGICCWQGAPVRLPDFLKADEENTAEESVSGETNGNANVEMADMSMSM